MTGQSDYAARVGTAGRLAYGSAWVTARPLNPFRGPQARPPAENLGD